MAGPHSDEDQRGSLLSQSSWSAKNIPNPEDRQNSGSSKLYIPDTGGPPTAWIEGDNA
jgi:hypothetical protein